MTTFLLSSSSCSSFIEEEKFQKWDHDTSLCLSSDMRDGLDRFAMIWHNSLISGER